MSDFIHHPAFGIALFTVLIAWPLWRITRRTGLDPRWALLVFVPGIGPLLVLMVLGHKSWPTLPKRTVRLLKARR